MHNFHIITNQYKDPKQEVTRRIQSYLESRGAIVSVDHPLEGCECMLVLGGDGTMLQAAAKAKGIPLIGVNMGTLGFLTEIEVTHLEGCLDKLLTDDYEIGERMMLQTRIISDRKDADFELEGPLSLNDVVLTRGGALQILQFHIYINGRLLSSYHGDGVIVSTPTGSTGYNLSAGGPIVKPEAHLMLVTPICSHTLNGHSIVLSDQDVIKIEICPGRDGSTQNVEVSFDGENPVRLASYDCIEISKAKETTRIIKIGKESFLDTLHAKLER